jgi:hypothetical protein
LDCRYYIFWTEARDYARFVIEMMWGSHIPLSTFNKMADLQIDIVEKVTSCLGIHSEQTPNEENTPKAEITITGFDPILHFIKT